jgi:3-methyladenine DNA glycosylase/8-oxoguanine DNA glycosylase
MHEKAIAHLSADPILAELIARVGPCKLRADRSQSPFQALVQAVAHQQLNGTAARTILNRVIALHPQRPFPSPEDLLDTHEDRLRGAGLSRAKVAAIKDICAKTLSGLVPPAQELARLDNEEIITRLTELRGVGRWTVEMLLIFKLGRMDILPVDDYGVRQGYALAYRKRQLPKPKQLLARGEPWRPYRSVAAWYFWRAVDLSRLPKAK